MPWTAEVGISTTLLQGRIATAFDFCGSIRFLIESGAACPGSVFHMCGVQSGNGQ